MTRCRRRITTINRHTIKDAADFDGIQLRAAKRRQMNKRVKLFTMTAVDCPLFVYITK